VFRVLFKTPGRRLAIVLAVLGCFTAGLVMIPMMMLMTSTAASSDDTTTTNEGSTCGPVATAGGETITLDQDQLANARTIIDVGLETKVPDRGLVVAVATALQESTLRNLNFGDRDSVGLFQQRNAWGSFDVRTDPAEAASMFYTGGSAGQPGLLDISSWGSLSITAAAQAVQRSAYPLAYAKWEPLAASLVKSVVGNDPLGCTDAVAANLPTGVVGAMLRVALQQQGDPYVWGAVGPDAFDCSGLVVFAWRQAGYQLKIRTAAQMFENSVPVPAGQEQPGDLLFGDFNDRVAGAGHVMIVISPGVAVQAPSTGRTVEITHYTADGVKWRLGRLKTSVVVKLGSNSAA
jgi:cell wall-associated NlpC family hydrolase